MVEVYKKLADADLPVIIVFTQKYGICIHKF